MAGSCFRLYAGQELTAGGPGTCATGTLGQARLVYQDGDSSLPRCDFCNSGHPLCCQREMARSTMRGSVQISVAYPAASAPFFSSCASFCTCGSDSWRGRPRAPSRATRSCRSHVGSLALLCDGADSHQSGKLGAGARRLWMEPPAVNRSMPSAASARLDASRGPQVAQEQPRSAVDFKWSVTH
jgi:hypothetical protein